MSWGNESYLPQKHQSARSQFCKTNWKLAKKHTTNRNWVRLRWEAVAFEPRQHLVPTVSYNRGLILGGMGKTKSWWSPFFPCLCCERAIEDKLSRELSTLVPISLKSLLWIINFGWVVAANLCCSFSPLLLFPIQVANNQRRLTALCYH